MNSKYELLKTCSGNLWKTFRQLLDEPVNNKEKFIMHVLDVFRDKVNEYKDTPVYSYAVKYSHALIDELERNIYKDKLVSTNYSNVTDMDYDEFCKYMKNPNPHDMILVKQDNGDTARVSISALTSSHD